MKTIANIQIHIRSYKKTFPLVLNPNPYFSSLLQRDRILLAFHLFFKYFYLIYKWFFYTICVIFR